MAKESLNPPYGGTLIQRTCPRSQAPETLEPFLVVEEVVESDLINIATGVFSPLTGFMNQADFQSVCSDNRLSPKKLPWTIPIVFDVSAEEKKSVPSSGRVYLRSARTQNWLGWIEPSEIFAHDKKLHIRSTFSTEDLSHPGVKRVSAMKDFLLAGEVTVFTEALDSEPLAYPMGVRSKLNELRIEKIAGFQTRNIPHRAHEHLQRLGLEFVGGLLVHPVVGWKKTGDFRPEVLKDVYQNFIGEFYPKEKALLAFLRLAMRYAGPREAVFHAIVRKNFGCSHFIVGRDHAGVGGFYGTYAAHEIFQSLPDLGIGILKLREPFFCRVCEGITSDRACGHEDSDREYISGTMIREILKRGSDPVGHVFRPQVLRTLSKYKNAELFYE